MGRPTSAAPRALLELERRCAQLPSPPPIPHLEPSGGPIDPALEAAVDAALAEIGERPAAGSAYGRLGRLYQAHRYFELAVRAYEVAYCLDRDTADWPYLLAFLAAERGEHGRAVALFERTLELRPRDLPAAWRLGGSLLAANRLEAARTVFAELAEHHPDRPWGHLGLAKVARLEGDLERARSALERAWELDGDHRESAYLLAMTYRELGLRDRAEPLFARTEELEPAVPADPLLREMSRSRSDLQGLIERANLLLERGRGADAETVYRQILEIDPDHFDALYNLGVLLGRFGRYQEAAHALEAAVGVRPDSADAHFLLGFAYSSLGRHQEAQRQLDRTLEIDPGYEKAQPPG